jgi:parvulin-like peptidyl-prolyl isomerase
VAGIACGRLVAASITCRDAIGGLFGRGHLLALAQGQGIYEADVQRQLEEMRSAGGGKDEHPSNDIMERNAIISRLVADAIIHSVAAREGISPAALDHEVGVSESQFGDKKAWRRALRASGLSAGWFGRTLADRLRARRWIERQLMHQLGVSVDEARRYYDEHLETFSQPMRFRANHLFLAAPAEAPEEVIEEKNEAIASLATRISHGESLPELAALTSEDEATKTRGGDLGFFSKYRMPPDFVAAVVKMHVGEISSPVRTPLGFHIIQLTDLRPARQMVFEEARQEAVLALENEKRQSAVQSLVADLVRRAEFVRPPG